MPLKLSQKIHRQITIRYALALTLLALLSTSAYVSFYLLLTETKQVAEVVNIAGKQRMLSQQIVLFATQQVHQAPTGEDNHRQALLHRIETMRQAHKTLTDRHRLPQQNLQKLSKLEAHYFNHKGLDHQVQTFLQQAEILANTPVSNLHQQLDAYQYLINQRADILKNLDLAVYYYQLNGEAEIEQLRLLELIVWLLTLSVLVLEVMFIFKPIATQVKLAITRIENHESEMAKQVDLKTKELQKANEHLLEISQTDELTQLKNKRTLMAELTLMQTSYEQEQQPYALIVFDLDHFKKLNDTFGHLCGDEVLIALANLILQIKPANSTAARFGGEEFVLLLPNSHLHEAEEWALDLKNRIQTMTTDCDQKTTQVTASFGVASSDELDPITETDVLKHADEALYMAKSTGRNKICAAPVNKRIG